MSKKFSIATVFAVLVVAAVVLVLFRPAPQPWKPKVRLTFAGFSTTAVATNAKFLVHDDVFNEGEVAWLLRETSHGEGTNWVACDLDSLGGAGIDWLHTSNGIHVLVPVTTTNANSRIVIELKKRRRGLTRVWDDMRGTAAVFRGRDVDTGWGGESFFITNETRTAVE